MAGVVTQLTSDLGHRFSQIKFVVPVHGFLLLSSSPYPSLFKRENDLLTYVVLLLENLPLICTMHLI